LFLFALFAQLPDDTLGPELAVTTRVCAGLTVIEAFLTIPDFHLAALYGSIPIRMMTAFHGAASYPVIFC
jgi:hypothetical protein